MSWSNVTSTSGDTLIYDYTTSISKTFGNNAKLVNGAASFYSGDVDSLRDGCVNLTDVIRIFNGASLFTTGSYLLTDLNWDGATNLPDIVLASNNNTAFICKNQPSGAVSPSGEESGNEEVFNYVITKLNTETIIIPDLFSLTKDQWYFRNNLRNKARKC